MNNIQKDIRNADGTIETLLISSYNNTCPLDLTKKYKLANNTQPKENILVSKFKNSIFGADIGVKAEGFSNVVILATIIAIAVFSIMFISWRI